MEAHHMSTAFLIGAVIFLGWPFLLDEPNHRFCPTLGQSGNRLKRN